MTLPSVKPGIGAVELGNVATIKSAFGPASIERFYRQRQVVISANLEGMATGQAVDLITAKLKTLELPPTYQFEFLGQAKMLAEQVSSFIIAFNLSFLFMYMILAAQFESFVHPISIMIALPLTIPFAITALILMNTNLDIYAMFGLFMLLVSSRRMGFCR